MLLMSEFHSLFPRFKSKRPPIDRYNHDTIGKSHTFLASGHSRAGTQRLSCSPSSKPTGMIVVDKNGRIACGTSTNGATHKIAGLGFSRLISLVPRPCSRTVVWSGNETISRTAVCVRIVFIAA